MKTPTFIEGAVVGLIAAVGASIAHTVLRLALPRGESLALVIAGVGLGYCLYLLARSPERAGRLVMVALWIAATLLAWGLAPGPWTQLMVQSGLVWLLRSLYHQPTPLAAVLDAGLIVIGLAAAVWAGLHTGSLLLALWCLFLVQALFVGIRDLVGVRAGSRRGADGPPDPFDLARRAAEAALSRLARRHPA